MPCCGVAQRLAAAAIVLAIVAARMISGGPGALSPHASRVALATAVSPARVPARSLRADCETSDAVHRAVPGALTTPAPTLLPTPPPPIAAPRFVDPSPPRPRLAAAVARARAPPRAA